MVEAIKQPEQTRKLQLTESRSVRRINPAQTGIAFGAAIGSWHVCWALLVAVGWAQPLMDFVFKLHFIKPVYVVQPFDPATASLLVAITAMVGYAFGYVFSVVWNAMSKAK